MVIEFLKIVLWAVIYSLGFFLTVYTVKIGCHYFKIYNIKKSLDNNKKALGKYDLKRDDRLDKAVIDDTAK